LLFGPRSVIRTFGQADPFEGSNALLVTATTNSDVHTSVYSITGLEIDQTYTVSVYLKGIGIGKVLVGLTLAGLGLNGQSAIDLILGTLDSQFSGFTNHTLASVDSGYYRYSFTFTAVQQTASYIIYIISDTYQAVWSGDGISGFIGFGAH
jgi:hypothetical protein